MTYFNMDSFGADCPVNWEEIADYLNAVLTARLGDDFDEEGPDTIETADSVWESYFHGDFPDAPKPVMMVNVTLYIARTADSNSDSQREFFTLEEARKTARMFFDHLTPRERETHTVSVEGYRIQCADTATPREAFNAWTEEQCWMPDPDFYEEITE